MSIPCVTNDLFGVKSCLQEGKHLSSCDGRNLSGGECTKCLPRPAEHGLLCWTCWERLTLTLARWPVFAATIRPLGRVMMQDTLGIRSSSSGHVGLTATMLAVDEVESHLLRLTEVNANVDKWVNTFEGASDAIRFLRAAEKAFKDYPLEEGTRRTRLLCAKCGQKSLDWNPPADVGRPVIIMCRNTDCQTVYTQDEYELLEMSA